MQDVCADQARISTKAIRAGLRKAKIRCRHSTEQLGNFVGRHNSKHKIAPQAHQTETPVELLRTHVAKLCEHEGTLAHSGQGQLHILRDTREPIISRERVYIPFASKGMLACVRSARGQFLKIVLDGKQKVLNNSWTILTIGFIVRRQTLTKTSARYHAGKRTQLKAHTSTMQPFMQAVIDTESEENITAAFEDAITLCQANGGVDLRAWLIQIHKDYAKGIEAARKRVFKSVRAVEDYFHMLQRVQNTLPTKLSKQMNVIEEQAGDTEATQPKAAPPDPQDQARKSKQEAVSKAQAAKPEAAPTDTQKRGRQKRERPVNK